MVFDRRTVFGGGVGGVAIQVGVAGGKRTRKDAAAESPGVLNDGRDSP